MCKQNREAAAPEFRRCEIPATAKSTRGRKALPPGEKQIDANIYAKQADIDFLLTWNNSGTSLAFAELINVLRSLHPTGRFSVPTPPPGCKDKPGTKTTLKREKVALARRVDLLEKQLRAAGIEPVQ